MRLVRILKNKHSIWPCPINFWFQFELADHLQDRVASFINVTFHWAEQNYPLMARILQAGHALRKTQQAQLPGMPQMVEMLDESSSFAKIQQKLKNYNLPVQDYNKLTIDEAIKEFTSKHNFTVKDNPALQNATRSLMTNPVVKAIIKDVVTTNVNGMPFALSILFLSQHIGSNVKIGQLSNATVINEISKNITREVAPLIQKKLERGYKAIDKGYEKGSEQAIAYIKEQAKYGIDNFGDVAQKFSLFVYERAKNATIEYIKYKWG